VSINLPKGLHRQFAVRHQSAERFVAADAQGTANHKPGAFLGFIYESENRAEKGPRFSVYRQPNRNL